MQRAHRPPRNPLNAPRAGRGIFDFRVPPLDLAVFARELIGWRGDERVLIAGAEAGRYAERFVEAQPEISVVSRADLKALDADAFDVAVSLDRLQTGHDVEVAIAALRHATQRWGTLLVAADSESHLREIFALVQEAVSAVTGRPAGIGDPDAAFTLENGQAILEGTFSDARRKASWGSLAVTDPAAIVEHVTGIGPGRAGVPDEVWPDLLAFVEARVGAVIRDRGAFDVATRTGFFVCR